MSSELLRLTNKYSCGFSLAGGDDFVCACVQGDVVSVMNLTQLLDPLDGRLGVKHWLVATGPRLDELGWKLISEEGAVETLGEMRPFTRLPFYIKSGSKKVFRRGVLSAKANAGGHRTSEMLEESRWRYESLPISKPMTTYNPLTNTVLETGKTPRCAPTGRRPIERVGKSQLTSYLCHGLSRAYSGALFGPRLLKKSVKDHQWPLVMFTRDGDIVLTTVNWTLLFAQSAARSLKLRANLFRDMLENVGTPIPGCRVLHQPATNSIGEQEELAPGTFVSVEQSFSWCHGLPIRIEAEYPHEEWSFRLREWRASFAKQPLTSSRALMISACSDALFVYILDAEQNLAFAPDSLEQDPIIPISWCALGRNSRSESALAVITSLSIEITGRQGLYVHCVVVAGFADGVSIVATMSLKMVSPSEVTVTWDQIHELVLPLKLPIFGIAQKIKSQTCSRHSLKTIIQVALGLSDRLIYITYQSDTRVAHDVRTSSLAFCWHNYKPAQPGLVRTLVSPSSGGTMMFWNSQIIVQDRGNKVAWAGPMDETDQLREFEWSTASVDSAALIPITDYGTYATQSSNVQVVEALDIDLAIKKLCSYNQRFTPGGILASCGMVIFQDVLGQIASIGATYVALLSNIHSPVVEWVKLVLHSWKTANLQGYNSEDEYLFRIGELSTWRMACKGGDRTAIGLSTTLDLLDEEKSIPAPVESTPSPTGSSELAYLIEPNDDVDHAMLQIFKYLIRSDGRDATDDIFRPLIITFNTHLSPKQRLRILFLLRGLTSVTDYRMRAEDLPLLQRKLMCRLITLWTQIWTNNSPDVFTAQICKCPVISKVDEKSGAWDFALMLLSEQEISANIDEISFAEPNPYCVHCGSYLFRFMFESGSNWTHAVPLLEASQNGIYCPFCQQPLILPD